MKYAVMILFVSAGFSFAADDEASKKLLKELEGTYKIASGEAGAEPLPARDVEEVEKISIKGNKFSLNRKGEDGKIETKVATITVDATKKPAHIDMKWDSQDKIRLGIIAIDGDTVKICFDKYPDPKRPTEFKTSKEDGNELLTLKKINE